MTLLDTNTLIYYLKGEANVVAHLHGSSPQQVGIPTIVAYEIEFGTLKIGSPQRRAKVSALLSGLKHFPFDSAAAQESARVRFELERRGIGIGPMDVLIAGTALSLNAVLATSNTKEFSRVKGLKLADWAK